MYGKCWRDTFQTVSTAKAEDTPMLWSWSIVVNGNGGLKMSHASTCARSQQKCSETRLDKKRDENVADTTAKRTTPQKTNPILRAQKIWICYDSLQITMFWCLFLSAHWNCAEFREFLKLQRYKTMRSCTFFCCSQQIFFYKVMQRHARKTVRRDVLVEMFVKLEVYWDRSKIASKERLNFGLCSPFLEAMRRMLRNCRKPYFG